MDVDRAMSAMAALVTAFEEDRTDLNEADTRHRFIDALLHDVLNWPPTLLQCEAPVTGGGYQDYVLASGGALAVLEAKREGTTFLLPSGAKGFDLISLEVLSSFSPATQAAIQQVLHYAQTEGIAVAGICNGHQLAYFLASRQDGVPPLKGKAVVYASLKDMSENFSTLWEDLSRDGLIAGRLRSRLMRTGATVLPPEKLSARIHGYPGFRYRTELETDLSNLADIFLVDLMQEKEVSDDFVRECYCASGALSQYSSVSKQILKYRYTQVQGAPTITPVRTKKGLSPSLTSDTIAAAMSRRAIVLLGDVGVGKTFFLRHLLRVEAVEVLRSSEVIYVDFLKESSLLADMRDHLADEVDRVLRERLNVRSAEDQLVRRIYKKELDELSSGIYGRLKGSNPAAYALKEIELLETRTHDRISHLTHVLTQLQVERGVSFVLILDNVDHHAPTFQEEIFRIGQSLAQKWPVTVFISLRPDTFHKSSRDGSLTAYHPRVFTVPPPRVDLVIERRLDFARRQLQETGRLESFPEGLTIDSDNLLTYLDVLIEAFTAQTDFVELIDNLSNGNVRLALQMISEFVGSGYVSIRRILDLDSQGKRYTMPLHELLRALLFGEGDYYDPARSNIPNLLDITTKDGAEHFLTPILLTVAEAASDQQVHGYVANDLLFRESQPIGYETHQIERHLDWAVHRKLLERAESNPSLYRITQAGGYMRKVMLSRFGYLDAVLVDTPIVDVKWRSRIGVVTSIYERLSRAEDFLDYLDQQWGNVGAGGSYDWLETSRVARADMARARSGANRNILRNE